MDIEGMTVLTTVEEMKGSSIYFNRRKDMHIY